MITSKSIVKLSVVSSLLGALALYGVAGVTVVEPGEVRLLVKQIGSNRGMQKEVLRTGTRWVDPFKYDTPVYNYQSKQYDKGLTDIPTQTKDGQPVTVDVSLEISLEPSKIPELHETIGEEFYQQVVYPALRSAIRDKVPSEESDAIYTSIGRENVQKRIQDTLVEKLEHRGIKVIVNLRDIDFTNNDFVESLEEKAKAAQKVIIEKRYAEAAEQVAIRTANIAEGDKQRRIKAAEADREERILKGEGDRLLKEETAKGNLAIYLAEAEGIKAKREAYAGAGGAELVSIAWAENMGPNVKVYGIPTGAPGTSSIMDLNGILEGALKGPVK